MTRRGCAGSTGKGDCRPGRPAAGCGKILDAWFALGPGTVPRASSERCRSVSSCLCCGTLHEFVGEPLTLRRLEGDELILALAHPEIKRLRGKVLIAAAAVAGSSRK